MTSHITAKNTYKQDQYVRNRVNSTTFVFEYAHRLNDELLLFRNSLQCMSATFLILLTFRPRLKPSSELSV